MKRIDYLIQKLASIAPKAASLAIVVVSSLTASPMAFAQCSFTQIANPVHAPANRNGFGTHGTINGISATTGWETFTQSGNFTLDSLQVAYQNDSGNLIAVSASAKEAVQFPSSPFEVNFTAMVPYSATAGQTAHVTMNVFYPPYKGGTANPGNWAYYAVPYPMCSSTVTVVVDPICSGNAALIQSSLQKPGNFEVVFPNDQVSSPGQVPGDGIVHYFRDNTNGNTWHYDTVFGATAGVVDAVSLIESSPGNLEVVARIGSQLAYFYRDWAGWHETPPFASGVGVSGTPSFIRSRSGNFEVVTPLAAGGMVHYSSSNGNVWTRVDKEFAISYDVSGVSLIESSYGNLEVVANIGNQLDHFWRDSNGTWHEAGVFANGVAGTPSLIQDPSPATGPPGNFEVVTPLAAGGMAHYYRDNHSYSFQPWYGPIAQFGSGNVNSAALIRSTYGNLEVVSRAAACSVDHYYRDHLNNQWSSPTIIVP